MTQLIVNWELCLLVPGRVGGGSGPGTPKPVSAGEAVVAMLPAVASSALMRLAVEPTDESWANCDGGLT